MNDSFSGEEMQEEYEKKEKVTICSSKTNGYELGTISKILRTVLMANVVVTILYIRL